jgi:aspartate kinase
MDIFKFGGASLQSPDRIKQVANIIQQHKEEKLLVVVSAMGKTTNALEEVVALAMAKKDFTTELGAIKSYHVDQAKALNVLPSVETELLRAFEHITIGQPSG